MRHVGIIGCGNIAKVHSEVLKRMDHVDIIAFADCKKERAYDFANKYRGGEARVYASLEEMLLSEKLDVVHICTPHYLHVPMAQLCLENGIHAFIEKPPAISMPQFEELIRIQDRSKRQIGVCFQNRYNRSFLNAMNIVKDAVFGKVKGARAFLTWSRDESYYTESGWRGSLTTEGGGVLINQAIHTLDLIVHFLGWPQLVEASTANHHLKSVIEVEDTVEAYIQFSDATACFYATSAYVTDAPIVLELQCEKGIIRIEGDDLLAWDDKGVEKEYSSNCDPIYGKSYWGSSHGACIEDFYNCLDSGEAYKNSLESCKATFLLAMDIYESAKSGKVIKCRSH